MGATAPSISELDCELCMNQLEKNTWTCSGAGCRKRDEYKMQ